MKFTYCPHCGTKAVPRRIGDEGEVPFCENCNMPLFDMFPTCVLSVVADENGEILLIQQSYGDTSKFVGVAGYIKPGESAEQAAVREITEETGLAAESAEFLESIWYESKQMLMVGFLARVKHAETSLSGEVKSARWFPPKDAAATVRQGSIIQQLIITAEERLK
ncbi:NAD+ diphosphatase [Ruminococcus sp. YE71]|uniref:NAD(+) diphosphatase n=1 Tax=unclassified Ruminococcus TaxID=2608920 RepID=UPI00087E77DA|nr:MULTISPECIES: NUDIX domain-containing protein [unclassified Ruminococcus]SDA16219.1 NAD+ diphosphatase [Ruminococcus sp. YE78]SFW24231.1 NAD+ diphosphatase [Ruminococcus sp. YE71]